MSTKKRIAVLMGGASSEHDVSLMSGSMAAKHLPSQHYETIPITIQRDGSWVFPGQESMSFVNALVCLKSLRPDVVFIALHGVFGEDGRIQAVLDLMDIPYTASGCAASALALDKIRSKAMMAEAGFLIARQKIIQSDEWQKEPGAILQKIITDLGWPSVVKSPCQGSSLGMSIVHDEPSLRRGIDDAFRYGDVVMIEEFIRGREVTCSVLDVTPGARPRALPVTEICPVTSDFFDYHAKYTPGACKEITPADIPPALAAEIGELAVRAHEIMGCRGLSRSDMLLSEQGPVWIEINTIPGLTQTSLFPQAAAAVGISFPELLSLLVESALIPKRTVKGY